MKADGHVVVLVLVVVAAFAVIWNGMRPGETDVYRAALAEYAGLNRAVLASNPSTCGIDSTSHPSLAMTNPDLATGFLAANAAGTKPVSLSGLRDLFPVTEIDALRAHEAAGISRETCWTSGRWSACHASASIPRRPKHCSAPRVAVAG